MPNLDFYAVESDLTTVLEFVFSEDSLRVYESFSPYGAELVEFHSVLEVAERYALGLPSTYLQLAPRNAEAAVRVERIELKPAICGGATFRNRVRGWGLIQLYLGGLQSSGIVPSHTNHNSERRARALEAQYTQLGSVAAWDWAEVARVSSRLNRFIRKCSVTRVGAKPILPEAARLISQGITPL